MIIETSKQRGKPFAQRGLNRNQMDIDGGDHPYGKNTATTSNLNRSAERPGSGLSNNALQGLHSGSSRPTRMGMMQNLNQQS